MPRSVKVKLGDVEYAFPPLNLGQQEDLFDFPTDAAGKYLDENGAPVSDKVQVARRLDSAQIMFRRATPPIANVRELECSWSDIAEAMVAIYRVSGMTKEPASGEAEAKAEITSGSSLAA